jgi:hypothetical protein
MREDIPYVILSDTPVSHMLFRTVSVIRVYGLVVFAKQSPLFRKWLFMGRAEGWMEPLRPTTSARNGTVSQMYREVT